MPSFCCVLNCSMRGERDPVSFYRIPAIVVRSGDVIKKLTTLRQTRWLRALKRGQLTQNQLKTWRVCSRHFLSGKPAPLEEKENPDWIPNRNLGYFIENENNNTSVARYKRHQKRIKRYDETSISEVQNSTNLVESSEPVEQESSFCSTSVQSQTELTVEELANLMEGLQIPNEKIYSLQSHIKKIFDINEESFINDNKKTLYFTGLPKAKILFLLHDLVKCHLTTHHNNTLTTFQQLLLTFMKLSLNLPFKYLSYRFGVSPFTASQTFYRTIDVLYSKLKSLILWPTRELLKKNVPACFRACFGNRVTVIIDCFEVFTETPSDLAASAQLWSNYKHHHTVKFLLGITPQGSISFISDAWGGRTSDKFLTENCGFLDLIQPQDVVIADRGFLIKDSIQMLQAKLEIPVFTKGKNQLHPIELEKTRNIATVRIHVERIIGLLKKKYKIFRGPIPISMLSTQRHNVNCLDKIVTVCSSLINLCPPQVPLK